jgi:hypothetical protein
MPHSSERPNSALFRCLLMSYLPTMTVPWIICTSVTTGKYWKGWKWPWHIISISQASACWETRKIARKNSGSVPNENRTHHLNKNQNRYQSSYQLLHPYYCITQFFRTVYLSHISTGRLVFTMYTELCGARGSVVTKALCYKPEGRGFGIRWGEFFNLPNSSCLTRPWGLPSLGHKWVPET